LADLPALHDVVSRNVEFGYCLPVARNEAELARWESLDPMLDALVADPELDVAVLVEDEILLAIPLVPMHPKANAIPLVWRSSAKIDRVGIVCRSRFFVMIFLNSSI
jgi:hypothetical protein